MASILWQTLSLRSVPVDSPLATLIRTLESVAARRGLTLSRWISGTQVT